MGTGHEDFKTNWIVKGYIGICGGEGIAAMLSRHFEQVGLLHCEGTCRTSKPSTGESTIDYAMATHNLVPLIEKMEVLDPD